MTKTFAFFRIAATVIAATFILASCSHANVSGPLPVVPQTHFNNAAAHDYGDYRVIYRFEGRDGANPDAIMSAVGGQLYGTTENGGNGSRGVVFSVAPDGYESVLHYFHGVSDGTAPNAGLTYVNGRFYGTTKTGGRHYAGTVFSVDVFGRERIVYNFKGGEDGRQPHSTLSHVGGLFYGTTYAGGRFDEGVAFALDAGGSEFVIHTFGKSYLEGIQPNTGFKIADNKLYSVTYGGGTHRAGTAYTLSFSGVERVVHNFGNGEDGSHPYNAQLLAAGGIFYGTTCNGGRYNHGTVYQLSRTGQERVLHSFGESSGDPSCPTAGLVMMRGLLYGTSSKGGRYNDGALFSVSFGGQSRVLHSFGVNQSDGQMPTAPLTVLRGVLYGTTYAGGSRLGYGTVFRYHPY